MAHKDSYVIGVDEAGLGPILGPLVVAGVRVNARHVSILQRLDVRDSKLFSNYKQSRLKRKLVWRRARLLLYATLYAAFYGKREEHGKRKTIR